MKVLILSCNNGGGHNAVAQALKEEFESHGDFCTVVDALSFLPAGWSKLASDTHSFVYRNCPKLFRRGYQHAEEHRVRFTYHHSISNLMSLGVRRLGGYLYDTDYDVAICTNVFAGILLSLTCQKYNLSLTTGIVETDYTATPGAEACILDWHFVPSRACVRELGKLGVPEKHIVATGIPVRKQFETGVSTKTALRELGLPDGTKHIVLACGSMGCGPMKEIVDAMILRMISGEVLSVVCGCNDKRREQFAQQYKELSNVNVVGRVKDMSLLLDSAAVYMTKPGGISTTEAAVKGVPMVLINAVGGCEQYNLDCFVNGGGALSASGIAEIADTALSVARDEHLHLAMCESLRRLSVPNASSVIIRIVREDVERRQQFFKMLEAYEK